MFHTAALVTGLSSLALVSLLYVIEVHSRKNSPLRDDMILMILVSLLIGAFTMGAAECFVGLRPLFVSEAAFDGALAAGTDLVAVAALVLTMVVFRVLVVAIRRRREVPTNVTPLTPRPAVPGSAPPSMKKAA